MIMEINYLWDSLFHVCLLQETPDSTAHNLLTPEPELAPHLLLDAQ